MIKYKRITRDNKAIKAQVIQRTALPAKTCVSEGFLHFYFFTRVQKIWRDGKLMKKKMDDGMCEKQR
ncbi:hypothetical protein CA265_05985 [Sphingobacteriaceae bacterium GW460-11-11-14-LB5]|nr:hypothetical protein CA265_05985 [Sphingobacteriaceae bacterium GW460-11-11-14-LB5]